MKGSNIKKNYFERFLSGSSVLSSCKISCFIFDPFRCRNTWHHVFLQTILGLMKKIFWVMSQNISTIPKSLTEHWNYSFYKLAANLREPDRWTTSEFTDSMVRKITIKITKFYNKNYNKKMTANPWEQDRWSTFLPMKFTDLTEKKLQCYFTIKSLQ